MKGIEDYKNSMKYPLTIYRGAEKKKEYCPYSHQISLN